MTPAPLFDVSGRRVLVTGGLGQIGTEFVRAFQSRDALRAREACARLGSPA